MKGNVKSSAPACGACRIQRKKCSDKCLLAPYFPPTDIRKFVIVHRVFGVTNIVKLLHDLPVEKRGDAVSSMIYEASVRIQDPVYGCAGAIRRLEQQVSELQSQLANIQLKFLNDRLQEAGLPPFISAIGTTNSILDTMNNTPDSDETDPMQLWEYPL
ncbi:LOB domain-containing protein 1 [Cryptomeria japonica]|uniref:LOB domain-containing protein 1 n=1 Tax=Cryptomeria japonica TaxID=3369 RepID=UPI0027DA7E5D|nr:LOB domain-containing protein 1 [Cryptomeria japonica]